MLVLTLGAVPPRWRPQLGRGESQNRIHDIANRRPAFVDRKTGRGQPARVVAAELRSHSSSESHCYSKTQGRIPHR